MSEIDGTDVVDDVAMARFTTMGAYGEVMLRFQLLEMSYWSILASRKPLGMSLAQHIAKLRKQDRQTAQRLINTLDLPPDLHREAMTAADARDLLAHRFLRERAVFFGDPRASNDATRVLAEVDKKIDDFKQRLEAYMRELGIDELDEDERATLERAVSPNFDTWSLMVAGKE